MIPNSLSSHTDWSVFWVWTFVSSPIWQQIGWYSLVKAKCPLCKQCWEVSLWAQSTLFTSVFPSFSIIAALTCSTGSSESKRLLQRHRWVCTPCLRYHGEPTNPCSSSRTPLGRPIPECPGSLKNMGFNTQPLTYSSHLLPYLCACTISW